MPPDPADRRTKELSYRWQPVRRCPIPDLMVIPDKAVSKQLPFVYLRGLLTVAPSIGTKAVLLRDLQVQP